VKISNEVKFGIIAIFTIAMIIYGLNYMSGSSLFGPPLVLYAKYQDVEGLLPGNPITINGLRVGKVGPLELDMEERVATARLEFDRDLDIPDNTQAMIYSTDLLGSKGIMIYRPDSVAPSPEYYETGDEMVGSLETGIFDQASNLVQDQGAQILVEVAKLSVKLNEIVTLTQELLLDENNSSSLRASLANIQATTENLTTITTEVDSIAREITSIANDAGSIVGNLENNNAQIETIISNVVNTTDSLVVASEEVKLIMADARSTVSRVESMMSKLDENDGTLGLLLNDRTLYDSITSTTENVNAVLREVKANPARFFDDIKIYLIERKDKTDTN
jgi:phospholipid/cholesterol/gamma-HCH transport system substrate-binding protein